MNEFLEPNNYFDLNKGKNIFEILTKEKGDQLIIKILNLRKDKGTNIPEQVKRKVVSDIIELAFSTETKVIDAKNLIEKNKQKLEMLLLELKQLKG